MVELSSPADLVAVMRLHAPWLLWLCVAFVTVVPWLLADSVLWEAEAAVVRCRREAGLLLFDWRGVESLADVTVEDSDGAQ